MRKKCRVIIIVVSILAIVFAVYNATWIWYLKVRFSPLEENLPIDYGVRIASIDNYSYSATEPRYLKFGGNLSLTNESTQEGLIIWPHFNGSYQLAALLKSDSESNALIMIYIDADGNYMDDSNELRKKEVYELNKESVSEMTVLADRMWHIKEK